jgi:hypothetical protein
VEVDAPSLTPRALRSQNRVVVGAQQEVQGVAARQGAAHQLIVDALEAAFKENRREILPECLGDMRAEHLQHLHLFAPTAETSKSSRLRPLIVKVHSALLDRILAAYASSVVEAIERHCCRYIVAARVIYSVAKVDKGAVLRALLVDDWSQIMSEAYFYEKSRPATGPTRSSRRVVNAPSQLRLEAAILRKVQSGELADAEALLTLYLFT